MINDNLMASNVEGSKSRVDEALSDLYTLGFSKNKLVAYSKDYHYAFDDSNYQFVLLDDNDNVGYPSSEVSKENIWALYNNQNTDKIDGITKYVTMAPIDDQIKFKSVFSGSKNSSITLTNGSIAVEGESNFIIDDSDSSVMTKKYFGDGNKDINFKENSNSINISNMALKITDANSANEFIGLINNSVDNEDTIVIENCLLVLIKHLIPISYL